MISNKNKNTDNKLVAKYFIDYPFE